MTMVYIKIFKATKRRLRERAKASAQLTVMASSCEPKGGNKQLLAPPFHPDLTTSTSSFHTEVEVENDSPPSNETPQRQNNLKASVSEKKSTDSVQTNGKDSDVGDNVESTVQAQTTATVSVTKYWEERQKISLSRERRAARILGIVMGVFVGK